MAYLDTYSDNFINDMYNNNLSISYEEINDKLHVTLKRKQFNFFNKAIRLLLENQPTASSSIERDDRNGANALKVKDQKEDAKMAQKAVVYAFNTPGGFNTSELSDSLEIEIGFTYIFSDIKYINNEVTVIFTKFTSNRNYNNVIDSEYKFKPHRIIYGLDNIDNKIKLSRWLYFKQESQLIKFKDEDPFHYNISSSSTVTNEKIKALYTEKLKKGALKEDNTYQILLYIFDFIKKVENDDLKDLQLIYTSEDTTSSDRVNLISEPVKVLQDLESKFSNTSKKTGNKDKRVKENLSESSSFNVEFTPEDYKYIESNINIIPFTLRAINYDNYNRIRSGFLKLNESIRGKLVNYIPGIKNLKYIYIKQTMGNSDKHVDINSDGEKAPDNYVIYLDDYNGEFVLFNDDGSEEVISLKKGTGINIKGRKHLTRNIDPTIWRTKIGPMDINGNPVGRPDQRFYYLIKKLLVRPPPIQKAYPGPSDYGTNNNKIPLINDIGSYLDDFKNINILTNIFNHHYNNLVALHLIKIMTKFFIGNTYVPLQGLDNMASFAPQIIIYLKNRNIQVLSIEDDNYNTHNVDFDNIEKIFIQHNFTSSYTNPRDMRNRFGLQEVKQQEMNTAMGDSEAPIMGATLIQENKVDYSQWEDPTTATENGPFYGISHPHGVYLNTKMLTSQWKQSLINSFFYDVESDNGFLQIYPLKPVSFSNMENEEDDLNTITNENPPKRSNKLNIFFLTLSILVLVSIIGVIIYLHLNKN